MNIPIFDKSEFAKHTNIQILCKKYNNGLINEILSFFKRKFNSKYVCRETPIEIIKNYRGFELFNPTSTDNEYMTIFSGKFSSLATKKIYTQFIDSELYPQDITKIFNGKNIIIYNGKISYYEHEIFAIYLKRYWSHPFSYHNITKIIEDINNKDSIFHKKNGLLYNGLISRHNIIIRLPFILMILTDDKIGLPTELRYKILYEMLSSWGVFDTSTNY